MLYIIIYPDPNIKQFKVAEDDITLKLAIF